MPTPNPVMPHMGHNQMAGFKSLHRDNYFNACQDEVNIGPGKSISGNGVWFLL